jgi:hypothetical protein
MRSFDEFWPFYLGEHAKPATRAFHFVGSTIALVLVASSAVTGSLWWILFAFLPGYGFAWFSHFFIEKNKPASFKYPLWSFIADWKMWSLILTGRIESEVEKHAGRRRDAVTPRGHSKASA